MILSAVSIALLSVTLLVFINYRRVLLKERMLIHFHLIIAVLCGNVSLMIGTALVTKDTIPTIPCIISAMSSHFFFLAVFMWSFVEGAFLFYKIVLVFHKSSIERLQRLSPVVGWVFPAIIVFTSFIISRTAINDQQPQNSTYLDPYANPATCFLTAHNGMIWSFLGPFLVIVSLNMIVLLRVSMVIYISAYSSSRLATSEKSIRLSGSLKMDTEEGADEIPKRHGGITSPLAGSLCQLSIY
uniref:G-protein coupled receptors family 2 profile 2 domain-containing protein n=1 Tax=Ciona savignyi TaxID=51511 RepID=H2Z0U0_CIOSA